jgi:tetratricopeptide (TPR) repeat protein
VQSQPNFALARHQLALAHVAAGNLQQAKVELRAALDAAPGFMNSVLLLARLNMQTDALAPAIHDLESFVAQQPNAAPAYLLLGEAYLQSREPVLASAAFSRVKELAPQDPRAPYLLGTSLLAQQKLAEAAAEFEASLALAPAYAEPLNRLVVIDVAQNRPEAALSRVEAQIAKAPDSGGLYLVLGRLRKLRGETELAEQAYLKALELDPRLMNGYAELVTLYTAAGDTAQAKAKIASGLEVDPDNAALLMISGMMYQQEGDVATAQAVYEKLLAKNPNLALAANNLAYIYSEQGGDAEKALELAQTAREAAPDNPQIADTLGWILSKRGLHQRALGLLRESADALPENAEVQYHLGMTYYRLGNDAEAERALAKALELSSDFLGADEARETLEALR